MIPQFPHFKKLALDDKKEVVNYTRQFPPYSDYNFVSLYSYNVSENIELSYLNGNLIILFEDYITAEPIFSFLGTHSIEKTIKVLLDEARKRRILEVLKLVPEINFSKVSSFEGYQINEDEDNFDYILSLKALFELKGVRYHDKRNLLNRFYRENPDVVIQELDLTNKKTQADIIDLFTLWALQKNKSIQETEHEKNAAQRNLDAASQFGLIAIGLYKQETMIGFAIAEIIENSYSVFHFIKTNTNFKGIFEATFVQLSKALLGKNCLYINYEQDLGIEGLRKSKKLWRPINYLKKYAVQRKM